MVVQSDCKQYKANTYSGATLRYLAKEGDIENHMSFQRASHLLTDIYFCWCSWSRAWDWYTLLNHKKRKHRMRWNRVSRSLKHHFCRPRLTCSTIYVSIEEPRRAQHKRNDILWKRCIHIHHFERALCITSRQTLHRDFMHNSSQWAFQHYLDAYAIQMYGMSPRWLYKWMSCTAKHSNCHTFGYCSMESECLVRVFDEGAMNQVDIETWSVLNEITKHSWIEYGWTATLIREHTDKRHRMVS